MTFSTQGTADVQIGAMKIRKAKKNEQLMNRQSADTATQTIPGAYRSDHTGHSQRFGMGRCAIW